MPIKSEMMTENTDTTALDEGPDTAAALPVGAVERAVAFLLGGQRYAVPIERVQEIQQIVALSDVPGGGPAVVGMVNLRGHVIPAVDARQLVGLAHAEYDLETPMIICRVADQPVALIVDEVDDVILLPEGCIQAVPPMHPLAEKLVGVCQIDSGLTYLVDLEAMLAGAGLMGWGK